MFTLWRLVEKGKMPHVCGSSDALYRVPGCLRLRFLETGLETKSCMQSSLGRALRSYTCREVRKAGLARQETAMQCGHRWHSADPVGSCGTEIAHRVVPVQLWRAIPSEPSAFLVVPVEGWGHLQIGGNLGGHLVWYLGGVYTMVALSSPTYSFILQPQSWMRQDNQTWVWPSYKVQKDNDQINTGARRKVKKGRYLPQQRMWEDSLGEIALNGGLRERPDFDR